jgi:hypothetical protein
VVRARDEHAWPEVYFPGIGWVEFEPTGNQAPLVRTLGEVLPPTGLAGTAAPAGPAGQNVKEKPTPTPAGATGSSSRSGTALNWLLGLIFICAILFIILRINSIGPFAEISKDDQGIARWSLPVFLKHFIEDQGLTSPDWLSHWAYLAALDPIERSFMIVYRSLHWLGARTTPTQTPAEAAATLAGLLPNVSEEIDSLLHEYQRQLYSQTRGRLRPARNAAQAIRQEALRAAIQQRWRTFRGIFRLGHR